MNNAILILIVSGFLAGCSLEANLLSELSQTPKPPTGPDGSNPDPVSTEPVQIQKIAFDFSIRKPIDFAENMAVTPDGSFLFVTAGDAYETFPFSLANESTRGAVVVYKKTGGTYVQHQILRHPVTSMNMFGSAVAASNDWAAIGTYLDNRLEDNTTSDALNSGSAILFKRNPSTDLWEYTQKLKAPGPERVTTMLFGNGLALDGNDLAVYAARADNSTYESGAVFMYKHDGTSWQLVQKITAAAPVGYRYFGAQPIFNSGKLFLSERDNGIPGRIDVFEYDGSLWTKTTSATTALPTGSECGSRIAVQGSLMAMACPSAYDSDGNLVVGQVNIFKFNGTTWVDTDTIEEGTGDDWASFGNDLAFSGSHLYVSGGFNSFGGRINKFEVSTNGTANKVKTILPQTQKANQAFGSKLIANNNILFANQLSPGKISAVAGAVSFYDVSTTDDALLGSVGIDAIPARNLSANAHFGAALAVSANGTNLMVGSPGNPYQENYPHGGAISAKANLGSVQFYKRNSDRTLNTLGTRSYGDNNRRDAGMVFGQAISASGNYAAVGSPGGKQWFGPPNNGVFESGLVTVYTADFSDTAVSWGSAINILPPDISGNIDTRFGAAVKLLDTRLVVGAPNHKLETPDKYGKVTAYSIDYVTWNASAVTSLSADPFQSADMQFGASLDHQNDILVVGAPGSSSTPDGKNAVGGGGVWIYSYDGTTATLMNILMGDHIYGNDGSVISAGNNSTWQPSDAFGSAVLIAGNRILVSSPGAASGAGAVFVYTFNSVSSNYEFAERLDMTLHSGQVATNNAAFGTSLVMADDLLVVGAPGENLDSEGTNPLSEAGAVFLLKNSGGGYKGFKKITPSGTGARTSHSHFGQALAYGDGSLYISSPDHDLDSNGADSVSGAGAVFVFDISGVITP